MFIFKENIYVTDVEVNDDDIHDELIQINSIRSNNPELAHFKNWPLFYAIGRYSEDVYAVNWADWFEGKDIGLLAYMYIKQFISHYFSRSFLLGRAK